MVSVSHVTWSPRTASLVHVGVAPVLGGVIIILLLELELAVDLLDGGGKTLAQAGDLGLLLDAHDEVALPVDADVQLAHLVADAGWLTGLHALHHGPQLSSTVIFKQLLLRPLHFCGERGP